MKRLFYLLGLISLLLSAASLISFVILDLGPLKEKAQRMNTTIFDQVLWTSDEAASQ